MSLFFGGVPTGPDVDALMAEIPAEPGTSVTYDRVAEIVGLDRTSSRWKTVTQAWRKRLFRDRLIQTSAEGGAFHFLTADAAQDKCRGRFNTIGRAVGRNRLRVEAIDPTDLTTEQKRTEHGLLQRETRALHDAAKAAAKAIALPAPVRPSAPLRDDK